MTDTDIINRLSSVLEDRKSAAADTSYVAGLYAAGLNKILEKVGEEATELIIAAKDESQDKSNVIKEAADLWFHTLILLSHLDLSPNELLRELERRFGTSGIDEKAARIK